jgi:hypothetical protein
LDALTGDGGGGAFRASGAAFDSTGTVLKGVREGDGGEGAARVFDEALVRLSETVAKAAGGDGSWLVRVRAGVVALLGFFDDEPGWGRLLIAGAGIAGVGVEEAAGFERERRVLGVLGGLLEDGAPRRLGELCPDARVTRELVAGGVLSVLRARVLEGDERPLVELAPSLMSFIALPYLGQAAASAELAGRYMPGGLAGCEADGSSRDVRLPMRATHRTLLVLRAIELAPRSSNREIAEVAGLSDEGQTSRLLSRLAAHGVIENVGVGQAGGEPNAWLLTGEGRRVLRVTGGVPRAASPRRRDGHAGRGRAA